MSTPLITPDLVLLDVDLGPTKTDVIKAMADLVAATGRADAEGLAADALAREEKAVTGLGGGIAIPHCRSAAVTTNTLAFARLSPKVDFGAPDGPADVAFMIAASEGSDDAHLQLLAMLARSLMRAEFMDALRSASTPEQIVDLVNQATSPEDSPASASAAGAVPTTASTDEGAGTTGEAPKKLIVAVTACPTGIAHTFMAADGLEQAGKAAGVELIVEPQGSGRIDWLSPELIARADAAIFATDVPVRERERFAGLPVIESGVKRAISEPAVLVTEALVAMDDPRAHRVETGAAGTGSAAAASGSQLSFGKRLQQALMTGVSYMIPFVAAGGLLIALGFLFGGYDIALAPDCSAITWTDAETCAGAGSLASLVLATNTLWSMPAGFILYLGAVLFTVGGVAFGFLIPALSGFIAFAIAGRPGIAPGFVGGAVSVAVGAGFIGGLITGLLAGVVAWWIASFRVPRWLAGLMPVVIIPLVATLVTGGTMYFLLGRPLAALTDSMMQGLQGMSGGSAVLLGVVLGLMMCFDLGGPVNKAAYLFATAGLSAGTAASFQVMAATMAAGMVPPLALALATVVRKSLFTEPEIENGRAAWLLGASFISEGAIPFAAADPLRVIPSMMVGGAVTGALSMALGVGLRAPHGGVFVLFAFDPLSSIAGFFISLIAGMVAAAAMVILLKTAWSRKEVVAA